MGLGLLARAGLLSISLVAPMSAWPANGQAASATPPMPASFIPSFWDPARRPQRPDTSGLHIVRFLTEDDYPPFDFLTPEGALTGFNVDLARAICDELKVACTIQARRWDNLLDALDQNQGDAIVASLAINARNSARVAFTAPYYVTPGRFVAKAAAMPAGAPTPESLAARKVAVVGKSAHEAYMRLFFPRTELAAYETVEAARAALAAGDVDALFADAIGSAVWLNGASSAHCCAFFGGPFLDRSFFGEGVGIATAKANAPLRRALDYALAELARRGVYAELYLKYFPIGPF